MTVPEYEVTDNKGKKKRKNFVQWTEDEWYAEKPELVREIRRGNTLYELGGKIKVLRKGMPKFFDMRLGSLSGGA